jgi:hypothetical protein
MSGNFRSDLLVERCQDLLFVVVVVVVSAQFCWHQPFFLNRYGSFVVNAQDLDAFLWFQRVDEINAAPPMPKASRSVSLIIWFISNV